MSNLSVGIVGLGLIGGSIAKNCRRVYPDSRIIVYNRSEGARTMALADGVANIATDKVDESFSECDFIFLCTPVEYNISYLKQLKAVMKPGAILTDAGSVKSDIHKAVIAEDMEAFFIGGHPMAGSEKTGYENASAHLLENAYFALTPTAKTQDEDMKRLEQFVSGLGAIPVILSYEEHDYAVAAISHVPHLIAAALVNLVEDSDSPNETMKSLAAGGFKDITRIASSSPVMWEQICMENQTNIASLLDDYIASMQEIREHVSDGNATAIYHLFDKSRTYRGTFSERKPGLLPKTYKIYCDIIDEAGAISTLATILASNGISIKNIGIVHNREFEEGVLRIEFYDEDSTKKSVELLKKYKYTVHMR